MAWNDEWRGRGDGQRNERYHDLSSKNDQDWEHAKREENARRKTPNTTADYESEWRKEANAHTKRPQDHGSRPLIK